MSGLTKLRCTCISDVCFQKWNPYLASMAADWADGCQWKHGQPARDADTMPFNQIGQNLYLTSSNTIDLSSAIQAWYDEISDYDYDTRACSNVCGHYTQVRQVTFVCGHYTQVHQVTLECDQEKGTLLLLPSLSYRVSVFKDLCEDMKCLQVIWA